MTLLKNTEVHKVCTGLFDEVLNLGLSARDARAVVADYATCCYATAKDWLIRVTPLIDFSALPDRISQIHTAKFDTYNWAQENPLVLAQVFESCIDPDLRKKNGCIYTPYPVVQFMVRSSVALTLRDATEGRVEWSTLELDEIKKETRIELLMGAQHGLSRIQAVDPSCGCGNFIYGMFQELTTLDREIAARLKELGETGETKVSIGQIYGVDIDPDAVEVCKRVMQFACLEALWVEPVGVFKNFKQGNSLEDPIIPKYPAAH